MGVEGPRSITAAELPALMDLVNGVFRPDAQGNVMGESYPYLFHNANLANLRVFTRAGRPVSHVGVLDWDLVTAGVRFPVAHVGSVCTHAGERGQGLATRLMKDAMASMRRRGTAICSISGGRGLYRRLGAQPASQLMQLELPPASPVDLPPATRPLRCQWEALSRRQLEDVVHLYQHELPRYARRRRDWPMLIGAQARRVRPRRRLECWLMVAAATEEVVAYALAAVPRSTAGSTPQDEEPPAAQVLEWAGARAAVACLLRWGTQGLPGVLKVSVTRRADPLLARLKADAVGMVQRSLPGTLIIVDAPAALQAVAPALDERWPSQALEAAYRLVQADDEAARTALTHLLFGLADAQTAAKARETLAARVSTVAQIEEDLPRLDLPSPLGMHYV